MYSFHQKWALMLASMVAVASCSPSINQTEMSEGRGKKLHKNLLILKQFYPYIAPAFFNTLVNIITNWFYPTSVVPPPPGKLGVAQLFGSFPPPVPYWRRR